MATGKRELIFYTAGGRRFKLYYATNRHVDDLLDDPDGVALTDNTTFEDFFKWILTKLRDLGLDSDKTNTIYDITLVKNTQLKHLVHQDVAHPPLHGERVMAVSWRLLPYIGAVGLPSSSFITRMNRGLKQAQKMRVCPHGPWAAHNLGRQFPLAGTPESEAQRFLMRRGGIGNPILFPPGRSWAGFRWEWRARLRAALAIETPCLDLKYPPRYKVVDRRGFRSGLGPAIVHGAPWHILNAEIDDDNVALEAKCGRLVEWQGNALVVEALRHGRDELGDGVQRTIFHVNLAFPGDPQGHTFLTHHAHLSHRERHGGAVVALGNPFGVLDVQGGNAVLDDGGLAHLDPKTTLVLQGMRHLKPFRVSYDPWNGDLSFRHHHSSHVMPLEVITNGLAGVDNPPLADAYHAAGTSPYLASFDTAPLMSARDAAQLQQHRAVNYNILVRNANETLYNFTQRRRSILSQHHPLGGGGPAPPVWPTMPVVVPGEHHGEVNNLGHMRQLAARAADPPARPPVRPPPPPAGPAAAAGAQLRYDPVILEHEAVPAAAPAAAEGEPAAEAGAAGAPDDPVILEHEAIPAGRFCRAGSVRGNCVMQGGRKRTRSKREKSRRRRRKRRRRRRTRRRKRWQKRRTRRRR